MSADEEIRQYLWALLDHESECGLENCPACVTAHQFYEQMRQRIFAGPVFPGVPIRARTNARLNKAIAWPRARRAAPHI